MADGLYAAIAQGGQPIQIENPLNQMAKVMSIKNAQQEAQLNALKMDEYKRELDATNMLAELAKGGLDLKSPEAIKKAYEISPSFGMKFEKTRAELEKANFERQKNQNELIDSRLKQSRQMLEGVASPDQYMQWHLANHKDPILGPMLAARGITPETSAARIRDAMSRPGGLEELINQSKLGVEKFMEMNKPTVREQDLGGATRMLSTPGLGGPASVVPGSQAAKTLSPEQTRAAAQERQVVAHTTTDEAGNVTAINKFGQVITPTDASGKPVPIKGKPSATYEKTKNQREQLYRDLDAAISELSTISKPGGLIDQSTGSGAGRMVDIAAGFVGKSTPGAIATAKLKPIADMVLKMVPRFEGPQSDKDTQSYKEAAGQLADPTMPNDIRKAAATTIVRLMKNRKGQFVSESMAAEGTPATNGVDLNNPLLK